MVTPTAGAATAAMTPHRLAIAALRTLTLAVAITQAAAITTTPGATEGTTRARGETTLETTTPGVPAWAGPSPPPAAVAQVGLLPYNKQVFRYESYKCFFLLPM